MLKKFNWDPEKIPKILKLNNNSAESSVSPELIKAQKNILMKAALAFLTIVLTIVILFAMTSAWYTNIVHTSGLVFEVESWGFDGEITVEQGPILAGPGDGGIIGLSMDGTAGEILDVSIGVSKEDMLVNGENLDEDAMKKRFFFYVDKPGIKNGEQVDRFYINNTEDYTYTVFSEGSIRISEDFSNVPELKWQWVYDVLGYYVKGTVIESGGVSTMDVTEYLRPIEYDFDSVTFTEVAKLVDAGGEEITIQQKVIDTIEGVSAEAFLEKFSENDGYEGNINLTDSNETITEKIETADGKTYYQVSEGIYAYLCDYQEIESATEFDTVLGKMAGNKSEMKQEELEALRFPATVNISVQNRKETETVEVAELSAKVISEHSGEILKLANDVALTESLVIPENANVEIDLNGKSISFYGIEAKENAIEVPEGSSLLMLNGKVENEYSAKKTGRGILASGAEITLSGVEINGFDYGLRVTDNAAEKKDSVIRLYNCKTDAGTCGVYILGNGEASEQKTQLIIENSELKAEGFVICGGGNPDSRGTDIRIINSVLEGTGMDGWSIGIYQPQKDGETVIYKSKITARTGIALKAGSVEIIDSQIYGTGPYGEPGYAVSGSKDTGDAVYIEANYGHPISLVIKENSTLTANVKDCMALRVYEEDAPNVTVEIISGTFSSEVLENWVADGSILRSDKKTVSISASAQAETE